MKRLSVLLLAMAILLWTHGEVSAQKKADVDMYAKVLKSDKNPDRRLNAAQELAGIAKIKETYVKPHTGVLVEAFKSDSDPTVRAAAGSVLLAFMADPQEVQPVVIEVVGNEKEPGNVQAVGARLAAAYKIKDAVPALEAIKKREEAKDDPKMRDQRLMQAVNQALQALGK